MKIKLLFLLSIVILTGCGKSEDAESPESAPQKPFTEITSSNFEVVIVYENLQPGIETILTIYISDFFTNLPVDNASVLLDISGAEVVESPKRLEPGVYVSKVVFPSLKKYDFLVSVSTNGNDDLLAANEVDLEEKKEIVIETNFIESVLESFVFWTAAGVILLCLTAIIFYNIGRKNRKI